MAFGTILFRFGVQADKEFAVLRPREQNRVHASLSSISCVDVAAASNLIVRLEGSGTRLEARVTPGNNEIAVPLGDYTVWLEREGKIVSETKKVTVSAKKTVSERF